MVAYYSFVQYEDELGSEASWRVHQFGFGRIPWAMRRHLLTATTVPRDTFAATSSLFDEGESTDQSCNAEGRSDAGWSRCSDGRGEAACQRRKGAHPRVGA